MDIGIILYNTEGKVTFANHAAEYLIGLTTEEFNTEALNETLKNRFYDEFGNSFHRENWSSLHIFNQGKKRHDFTIEIRGNDNSRWIKGTSYSLDPKETGNLGFASLTTLYNITESIKAEESSRYHQEFLQLIFDYIPQFIFWKDRDLIYRGCNRNFAEAAGVGDPENIIGMSDYDLPWMKEEAENYRRDDQRVIDTDKPSLHIIETQLQSDQKQKWLDTNKIPLKSPDGTITGILGTFQDITEMIESRQKIEELLRSENVKLEQLVQEKTAELEITMTEFMNREKLASLGSLVAGVSHEINTPLGVALSSSSFLTEKNKIAYQMLMDGEMTKEGLIDYMKTVEESTEILNNSLYRAAELVKSFKAISVSQSSEIFSDFDLRDYINSVILTMKHEYKTTVQSLQLLPEKEIWISADPSSFSQIITNLLMNSLKHAFEPSQEGRIVIELEETKDHLTIRFEDNGKGIPQERILRIFDPFYTTALNNGGSGLGLSIIYNIVKEKLLGKIVCQSIVDEGTVFLITIPWGENLKHG